MGNWWDKYPDAPAPAGGGNWWDKYPDAPAEPASLGEKALDLYVKAKEWEGTRAAKVATGTLATPSAVYGAVNWAGDAVRDLVREPGRQLRTFLGLSPDNAPNGSAAMGGGPGASGMPERGAGAPTKADLDALVFKKLGLPEVNLPGPAGKIADAGTEALLGSAMWGGGVKNLIPGFGAGAGSEAAGQATEGTKWEPYARLAGLFAGGASGAAAQRGGQVAVDATKALFQPWTQAGRDAMLARALTEAATDPKAAAAAMAASKPTVPGSLPTAAQASADPGLLATENLLKAQPGKSGEFAMRAAESDRARMAMAKAIAPPTTPEVAGDTIRGAMQSRKDALELLRGKVADPLYTAAKAGDPSIPGAPIVARIDAQIAENTGAIRDALKSARGALYLGEGETARLASKPGEWHKARAAIDQMMAGERQGSPLHRELSIIRSTIDDAIKTGPLYKQADDAYQMLSEPLRPYTPEAAPRVAKALETGPYNGPYVRDAGNLPKDFLSRGSPGVRELAEAIGPNATGARGQMASVMLDDFRRKVMTAADNPLDEKVLSAASADRWLKANRATAEALMTPQQIKALETLVDDFAMGARRAQGVAGSNTFQNLAGGNIMQSILRTPGLTNSALGRTGAAIFGKLYSMPEKALQERLLEVMLDPKMAAALMSKATPENVALMGPMIEAAILGGLPSAASPQR